MSLCPACGLRDADDYDSGFCTSCVHQRAVEEYLTKDAEAIVARKAEWKARTASSSPHAARERQRRHRLREAVRPREAAQEWADPLELGKEALDALQRVRQALGAQVTARVYLDDACEKVKQLAWGPTGVKTEDVKQLVSRQFVEPDRHKRIVIVRPKAWIPIEGQSPLFEETA